MRNSVLVVLVLLVFIIRVQRVVRVEEEIAQAHRHGVAAERRCLRSASAFEVDRFLAQAGQQRFAPGGVFAQRMFRVGCASA